MNLARMALARRRATRKLGDGGNSADPSGRAANGALSRELPHQLGSLGPARPSPQDGGLGHQLSAQVEDELECVVDSSQFVNSQVPRVLGQRAHVDGADHLAHHPCLLSGDDDLGVKARTRG